MARAVLPVAIVLLLGTRPAVAQPGETQVDPIAACKADRSARMVAAQGNPDIQERTRILQSLPDCGLSVGYQGF